MGEDELLVVGMLVVGELLVGVVLVVVGAVLAGVANVPSARGGPGNGAEPGGRAARKFHGCADAPVSVFSMLSMASPGGPPGGQEGLYKGRRAFRRAGGRLRRDPCVVKAERTRRARQDKRRRGPSLSPCFSLSLLFPPSSLSLCLPLSRSLCLSPLLARPLDVLLILALDAEIGAQS